MDRNSVDWSGNTCAIVTPFNRDGSLDERSFRENIRLLIDEGIDGIVVAGCTGEFWSLSDEERLLLFELARDEAGDAIHVIGNVSAIRTADAIRFARAAQERNLDGIMLTPPFYARPGENEVLAHYQAVSNAVPLPILVYNIPSRQAITLSIDLLDKIADVENVVAVKQSSNAFQDVTETIRRLNGRIYVLPGHSVDRGVAALSMGADGYVSSVEPQALGRPAIALYRLCREGRWDEAQQVQMQCVEVDHAVHGGAGTFPGSLKAAMNLLGRPGGYPRDPLLPLTDEQEQYLKSVLRPLNLLATV
jgi:4-hydroxy-tetrahydrodipicolinate synthase